VNSTLALIDGTRSLNFNVNAGTAVYNGITAAGDQLIWSTAGSVDTGTLTIAPHSTGTLGMRIGSTANTVTIASNVTTFQSNGAATVMTLTNGRVSIGAGAFGGGSLLSFGQNIANKILTLYDINNGQNPVTATNFFGLGINNGVMRYQVNAIGDDHIFYGDTNEYARITNVGISVKTGADPTANLQVTGNAFVSNALTTTNVFASTLNLTTALAVTSGGTGTTTSTGTGSVVLSAAPTLTGTTNIATLLLGTALAVSEGGTGTTTSTGTGSVVLSNAPTLTGTTNMATLVASGNITSSSDRRIKKDIKRIEGALDKVTQIGGYTFTRTDDPHNDQRQAGIIAQEILEVLPEVVQISEETGYYSVSYGNITALLIEALKEERLERLKLEERLARLEKLVHDHPMK
jgi:hypothetical protein